MIKKNTFLNLIEGFDVVAKKERWQLSYDKIADFLYWSKKKISADSKLKKLSREVSFYIDKNGEVEGLMIQSFQNNFLTQNKSLAQTSIVKSINKTESGKPVIFNNKKEGIDAQMIGFSESIKNDILKDAFEANYTLRDLEKSLRV